MHYKNVKGSINTGDENYWFLELSLLPPFLQIAPLISLGLRTIFLLMTISLRGPQFFFSDQRIEILKCPEKSLEAQTSSFGTCPPSESPRPTDFPCTVFLLPHL